MNRIITTTFFALALALTSSSIYGQPTITEYDVPRGAHPHDVAPAPDGRIWYTAQHQGALGWLDPATGHTGQIPLGNRSRPHGVIVGPNGAPWITDSGLNAIIRVDPVTEKVTHYPLPRSENANLNTATFDRIGNLWFTGQGGVYGNLNPSSGIVTVYDAPRGRGPYGIDLAPDGYVYYASLAGSYVGRIDPESGEAFVLEPPISRQGARRVWADSHGVLWITGWNSGDLISYDPRTDNWEIYPLPGNRPKPYAVYVDEEDMVWVSDFGANAISMFNPLTNSFTVHKLPSRNAQVRQMLGREGEVWGAESGTDKLVVIRF